MTGVRKKSLLLCLIVLAGCSALPVGPAPQAESAGKGDGGTDAVPVPAPLPEAPETVSRSPAVDALLTMAREDRAAGHDEQAAVRLERALRIQPRDPTLWFELARIYYDKYDFATAAQFADKAARLAGSDEILEAQAIRLSADARRQGG